VQIGHGEYEEEQKGHRIERANEKRQHRPLHIRASHYAWIPANDRWPSLADVCLRYSMYRSVL